ncbi:MAG: CvpA family protein [Phaeodactylibacter sp.]|nr:CvpA family protein [Phaeodactylibacter sp.]
MTPVDIVLGLMIAYGAYKGYRKGLLIEIIGTVSLVLALFAGFALLDLVVSILSQYIEGADLFLPYIAFFAIFFGMIWLLRKVGWQVRKAVRYTLIGSFDTVAGGIVGALKVLFSISTILWIINLLGIQVPAQHTQDSFLYPIAVRIGPKAVRVASSVFPFLRDWIEEIKSIFEKIAT